MVKIKSDAEVKLMKEAGRVVALVHDELKKMIAPGVSTLELNELAERLILENKCIPSFKGYGGFPCSICTSVNEEVIHGIPSSRKLKKGDIISIDVGAIYEGYHGDAAFTAAVGSISEDKARLIKVTEESFFEGIKMAKAGNRLGDISHKIQEVVENAGYSVVKDYVGHGVGSELHEDPAIPNYGPPNRGLRLEAGMTLAIEPMVNMGGDSIYLLEDDWTVVTEDGKPSAHYEHTILITSKEPIILTRGHIYE